MPPVTGGLTYKALDIQSLSIFFDVMGSLYEPADHRGADDIVPGKAGRYRRNRVPDRRLIPLQGWTRGIGATVAERQQAWRAAEEALGAVLDPSAGPGALTVIAPYLGLPDGSATVQASVVEWTPGPVQNTMSYRRWSFVVECVDDPPNWDIDTGSS